MVRGMSGPISAAMAPILIMALTPTTSEIPDMNRAMTLGGDRPGKVILIRTALAMLRLPLMGAMDQGGGTGRAVSGPAFITTASIFTGTTDLPGAVTATLTARAGTGIGATATAAWEKRCVSTA